MRKVEGRNGLKRLELNLRVTMAAIFGFLSFNLEMFVGERQRKKESIFLSNTNFVNYVFNRFLSNLYFIIYYYNTFFYMQQCD